jgi:FMN reductase
VYKAGISGLLKSFIDDQLWPLFAFLRPLPTPTSIFAAPEDWAARSGEANGTLSGRTLSDDRQRHPRPDHRKGVGPVSTRLGRKRRTSRHGSDLDFNTISGGA